MKPSHPPQPTLAIPTPVPKGLYHNVLNFHRLMQMVIDVLNCELLNVGGRHYRVVGGASVSGTSHSRVHANSYEPTVPQVAGDDEEYDEDDASAFEIQEEASDFVIRLAYDAEVHHAISLNIPITHTHPEP